jgi:ATP-dependent helicase HrpB
LSNVSAVLFDEFLTLAHADLGLALALRRGWGRICVARDVATLDGARVATLLGDAPVVENQGRSPVEVAISASPARIEDDVTDAIMHALKQQTGSVLAFLPVR